MSRSFMLRTYWDYQCSNRRHVCSNILVMISVSRLANFWSLQSWISNCYIDLLITPILFQFNTLDMIQICLHLHIFKGCICPRTWLENIGLNSLAWKPLLRIYIPNYNILLGCFKFCDWLSLPCLRWWVNNMLPVSQYIFWQIYSK